MLLIGDVHGLFYNYKEIIKQTGARLSLQLGDFGIGFPDTPKHLDMSDFLGTHLFLRGNHDNPFHCRHSSNYIGDYGIYEGSFIEDRFTKLMYISGAWSIDQKWRTPGVSWWEDEQLSYEELSRAVNIYIKEEPDIVCSHDCPVMILQEMYKGLGPLIPTRTAQAMDSMIQHRMPSYWFFAHHHHSWRRTIDGCTFICLNELEYLDISKSITLPYGG